MAHPELAHTAGLDQAARDAFRRLVHLLRIEKQGLSVVLVYALGIGLASLAAPVGVQMLVGAIAFGGLVQPIVVLALLVLVGLAFAATLRAAQAWVVERIQQRLFVRVAADLTERLPRVRLSALESEHGPEVVNRFFDIVTLQKGAAMLLLDGVFVTLQVVVGGALLALYHPALLGFAAALLVAIVAILLGLGGRGPSTSIAESKAKYALVAWFEEVARHPSLFHDASGADFAHARSEALARDWVEKRQTHYRVVFRQSVAFLALQAVATAALLGIGGFLVLGGRLTLGQLVASELILTSVVAGFAKLGKYIETYYDLIAAVDKLGHLVDLPLENGGESRLSNGRGPVRLTLSSVELAHAGGVDALAPISLEIEPGEHIAVVGPSGSGKSTLLDLLYGFREPTRGHVEIDGLPLRDLALRHIRDRVALVRDPAIFEGTVHENVVLGRADIALEEVRAALEVVDLWDELVALPAGLGTVLATNGANLSSGQARRLAIARALAGRPGCILFDEALDELEPTTRDRILERVLGADAPWTVVVATNDEAVRRACTRVVGLSRPRRETSPVRGAA